MADLVYTGERAIPGLTPECTMTEHLARYRMARSHAAHKRVLDACCGVGYGSAMLAEVAREVVGFDVDQQSIAYAQKHYGKPNLRFEQCDVREWHEGDFDLVLAFEAIEHVYEVGAFVQTLHHSLRSQGTTMISMPSYLNCRQSPFHVRCLRQCDFEGYLSEWFTGHLFGQTGETIRSGLTQPDYWIFVGRPL